jgi:DNA-binding transcriptional LysR family regulator
VDLRALRYFVAVAEARSFTDAAKTLHVSQPALSQSIRRLERRLGTDLFVRNRQHPTAGLRLTEAGQALLVEATSILTAVARAEHRVRRVATGVDRLPVLIGFASSTPRELVMAAMTIEASLPRVEALPVHVTWGDEHTFLRDGRVDLAFLQYPRGARPPDYVVRTLTRVPRVLIVPVDHRLVRLSEVTLADLATESILDPGFADVPEMHRDFWLGEPQPRARGPFVVPLEVRTVEEMCACVAGGKGLAITSAVIASSYARPDLAFLPVVDLEPVDVGIAHLGDEHRPEVLQTFEAIAIRAEDPQLQGA